MDFTRDLAQDFLAATDRVMKHADAHQTAFVDVRIHRPWRHQVDNCDALALLAVPIDASDTLFNAHGIPRKVVVDQEVAELKVETFATDLRRQQRVQRVRIVFRKCEAATQLRAFLIRHATVDESEAQTSVRDVSRDIRQRVPEGAESQHLVVDHPVLIPQDLDESLYLGVLRIECFGPLDERLDIGCNLVEELGIDGNLCVSLVAQFEALQLTERISRRNGANPYRQLAA